MDIGEALKVFMWVNEQYKYYAACCRVWQNDQMDDMEQHYIAEI